MGEVIQAVELTVLSSTSTAPPTALYPHIMFATRCIKGQVLTFIKLHDKGQFNALILPNLKPNRFKYHVLNHGTSTTFIFIKIGTIQSKISFSQQGSFQYFHFTEFKTKQVHISCFTSRDKFKLPIYQTCRHIDQNRIFATKSLLEQGCFTSHLLSFDNNKVSK